MCAHFGIEMESLPKFLGNHLLRVDISYHEKFSSDGKLKYDWWGVEFYVEEEGYYTAYSKAMVFLPSVPRQKSTSKQR